MCDMIICTKDFFRLLCDLIRWDKIRYRIFIVHSKADYSQLNLPQGTVTKKQWQETKNKKWKISEVPEAVGNRGVSPKEREESMVGMISGKDRFSVGSKRERELWVMKEDMEQMQLKWWK